MELIGHIHGKYVVKGDLSNAYYFLPYYCYNLTFSPFIPCFLLLMFNSVFLLKAMEL